MIEEIMKLIELGSFANAMCLAEGIQEAVCRADAYKAIALAAIGVMPKKEAPIEQTMDMFLPAEAIEVASDECVLDKQFQQFWESWAIPGTKRKYGRGSKQEAKVVFKRMLKSEKDKQGFVDMICQDVKNRIELKQAGHDKIHAKRYLSGKRWLDEIVDDRPQYHQISQNQTMIPSTRDMSLEDEMSDRSWAQ